MGPYKSLPAISMCKWWALWCFHFIETSCFRSFFPFFAPLFGQTGPQQGQGFVASLCSFCEFYQYPARKYSNRKNGRKLFCAKKIYLNRHHSSSLIVRQLFHGEDISVNSSTAKISPLNKFSWYRLPSTVDSIVSTTSFRSWPEKGYCSWFELYNGFDGQTDAIENGRLGFD